MSNEFNTPDTPVATDPPTVEPPERDTSLDPPAEEDQPQKNPHLDKLNHEKAKLTHYHEIRAGKFPDAPPVSAEELHRQHYAVAKAEKAVAESLIAQHDEP